MAIFNSYVSLPEGKLNYQRDIQRSQASDNRQYTAAHATSGQSPSRQTPGLHESS